MAVLNDSDVAVECAAYQTECSAERTSIPVSRADLRAAFNAVNTWVENNQASFNSALPQPARGALSAKEKARILLRIVRRRFEVS